MSKTRTIRAAAKELSIISFPAQNTVSIKAESAADGTKGVAKFDVQVYGGGELRVAGYDVPVVIDLETAKTSKNIRANLDHKSEQRVGHVTDHRNDGRALGFSGIASAATQYRDEVVNSAADGYDWEASIEAKPGRLESIGKGKTAQVNGQTFSGPIVVARNALIRAFAFVSHGADPDTSVTIAAKVAPRKELNMKEEIKAWIESCGFDVGELSADQISAMTQNYEGLQATKAAKVAPKTTSELFAAERKEIERCEEITQIAAQCLLENKRSSEFVSAVEELTKRHIDSKSDVQAFELDLLRQIRGFSAPRIPIAPANKGVTDEMIMAAVCKSEGLAHLDKHFDEKTIDASEKKWKHGIGLQEILLMGARSRGHQIDNARDTEGLLRACFDNGDRDIRAAEFSTLTIPGILSNIANKFLLASFNAVESTWRNISAIRSVKDFKTATSYSLTGAMQYEKVGASGELKHGTLGQLSYTNKADTYGLILGVTRADIVNDDLSALTGVPKKLGRGAALSLNNVFWTTWLNDSTIFPTSNANSNYLSGAGSLSVLGIDSLTSMMNLFLNQTDADGKPLALMPKILLVPAGLMIQAQQLMKSDGMRDTTATTKFGTANPFQGAFNVQFSAYLNNASLSGSSTTGFYLLADPADLAVIEVCFLNGVETPTVETAQADFDNLGIKMRGFHDFGVGLQEYRAGAKSKGAS